MRYLLSSLAVLLCCQFTCAQNPQQLVERMVHNELWADKNDHSHWMYRDSDSEKGKTTVKEVIQTPEGWMRRIISIDGRPPSPQEVRKNDEDLHRFLNDPNYRRQQREKEDSDGNKATQLLSMLPKAFLYKQVGEHDGAIELSFTPNPNFDPPTREAKVFHTMAGTLLINSKDMRMKLLRGHLIDNVNFGFGILGRLAKGGTFEVEQADVGGGHWELTRLDVHISGHALFFATIQEQQHEVMSDFQQVPPNITLAKAADILNAAASAQSTEASAKKQ
jgi:hypothetical protein